MKYKLLKKFLSLFLAISLVTNPVMVRVTMAEDSSDSANLNQDQQTEVQASPPPEITIDSGDAKAETITETTVNTTETTVPGEITTPSGNCTPPEGETSCPGDINIVTDSKASVEASSDALADTGNSSISGAPGDVILNAGDATASGNINNDISSNEVLFEPVSSPDPQPSAQPSSSPEASPSSEEKSLTVDNNNQTDLSNEGKIIANTGNNLVSDSLGDVTINTGDALAILNALNLLNTNIVGSDIETYVKNIMDGENTDVNWAQIWLEMMKGEGSNSLDLVGGSQESNLNLLIQNNNSANLSNNFCVDASTGNNLAIGNEDVNINTGDATALANVVNIANTNILGSKIFIGILNILGASSLNLILPREEYFSSGTSGEAGSDSLTFSNSNLAKVSDNNNALASTGGSGGSSTQTGDASSVANTTTFVNQNIFANDMFLLLVTNLGKWTGQYYGWGGAGESLTQEETNHFYTLGGGSGQENNEQENGQQTGTSFKNDNSIESKTNLEVTASTGGNETINNRGETNIKTGNAKAVSNLLNILNTNILGGRLFIGIVNSIGDWFGSAQSDYPDLVTTITDGVGDIKPGDTINYNLCYKNDGYGDALKSHVDFTLPEGTTFLEDSSGLSKDRNGNNISWFVGTVKPNEGKCFGVKIQLNSDFNGNDKISFWNKIIPQAHAAEKDSSITVRAQVETDDPESNYNNNASSDTTVVIFPKEEKGENKNTANEPVLEITAKNNVNDFIYEGDTVTFEITVKNTGNAPSYDTRFVQYLFNGMPEGFGTVNVDLGTIDPGQEGTISFGLLMGDGIKIPDGHYHTIAKVMGHKPDGSDISSSEARTDFNLKIKGFTDNSLEVKAAETSPKIIGEVLGTSISNNHPKPKENILPYILILLLSTFTITHWLRPKIIKT